MLADYNLVKEYHSTLFDETVLIVGESYHHNHRAIPPNPKGLVIYTLKEIDMLRAPAVKDMLSMVHMIKREFCQSQIERVDINIPWDPQETVVHPRVEESPSQSQNEDTTSVFFSQENLSEKSKEKLRELASHRRPLSGRR